MNYDMTDKRKIKRDFRVHVLIFKTVKNVNQLCSFQSQFIYGMGREEGGGFRMGNTCIPVADSF